MLILIKTIEVMLIKRRKKVSQQRILAFTKRLATLALQLLHNGSLSCLGHIKNVLQVGLELMLLFMIILILLLYNINLLSLILAE